MKNASHQFAAFGGGVAVVPGVRAAAGKAVGRAVITQSSLGLRILALALVDCTCYVFDDGARAVFLRF